MLAASALEMHVVIKVGLGAALDGAGGVAHYVGSIDYAVNQTAFLERFERAVQGNPVSIGVELLLNFAARHGKRSIGQYL
jgi:hypothetical protein